MSAITRAKLVSAARIWALIQFLTFSSVVGQSASPLQETAKRILQRNCVSCHGEQRMSGLDLRHRETMLEGGGKGPALVPGKAEESLLFLAASHGGELKMPPGKPPLPSQDLDALRDWIDMRRSLGLDGRRWRFCRTGLVVAPKTPANPPSPRSSNQGRVRNPIDAFILAETGKSGVGTGSGGGQADPDPQSRFRPDRFAAHSGAGGPLSSGFVSQCLRQAHPRPAGLAPLRGTLGQTLVGPGALRRQRRLRDRRVLSQLLALP